MPTSRPMNPAVRAEMLAGLHHFACGDVQRAAALWQATLVAHPAAAEIQQLLAALYLWDPSLRPPTPSAAGAAKAQPWNEPALTDAVEVQSDGIGLQALPGIQAPPPPLRVGASEMVAWQRKLHDLLTLHDFSGALEVATAILRVAPGYAPALRARAACSETLRHMYESRLGSLKAVPALMVRADEIPWLDLDPRAGFVLSQVDGASTFEEIMEIAGLPPLEALRILTKLVTNRVIGVPSQG